MASEEVTFETRPGREKGRGKSIPGRENCTAEGPEVRTGLVLEKQRGDRGGERKRRRSGGWKRVWSGGGAGVRVAPKSRPSLVGRRAVQRVGRDLRAPVGAGLGRRREGGHCPQPLPRLGAGWWAVNQPKLQRAKDKHSLKVVYS